MDVLDVQHLIDRIICKYDYTQTAKINDLCKEYPQFKDINTRIDIMIAQLGGFTQYFKVYAKAYGYLSKGYEAEARVCLAALLIQTEMFCVSKGWDINVLRNEGYEHLLGKIEEVEAKNGEMI